MRRDDETLGCHSLGQIGNIEELTAQRLVDLREYLAGTTCTVLLSSDRNSFHDNCMGFAVPQGGRPPHDDVLPCSPTPPW
jgi:hypothetical protein